MIAIIAALAVATFFLLSDSYAEPGPFEQATYKNGAQSLKEISEDEGQYLIEGRLLAKINTDYAISDVIERLESETAYTTPPAGNIRITVTVNEFSDLEGGTSDSTVMQEAALRLNELAEYIEAQGSCAPTYPLPKSYVVSCYGWSTTLTQPEVEEKLKELQIKEYDIDVHDTVTITVPIGEENRASKELSLWPEFISVGQSIFYPLNIQAL